MFQEKTETLTPHYSLARKKYRTIPGKTNGELQSSIFFEGNSLMIIFDIEDT